MVYCEPTLPIVLISALQSEAVSLASRLSSLGQQQRALRGHADSLSTRLSGAGRQQAAANANAEDLRLTINMYSDVIQNLAGAIDWQRL